MIMFHLPSFAERSLGADLPQNEHDEREDKEVLETRGNGHLMVQDVPATVYEYGQPSEYSIPVFLGPELIEAGHRTLLSNQMTDISNLSDEFYNAITEE
ncbi:hypothetical protein JMJ35_002838 [Cladonia borealis]|uniref:Uncharacterized protein n=1 Tax=Cladonia borealis TaxID=184061 RepID=A0AA39R688_9LECA|nr:hypothetical protein JMJ35_002838 [Cladonia borealis]